MPLIIKCAKCHKNFTLDESNPTCPWCVPAIFWADPNHNEAKHVVGLIEALPKLYTGGYRTLFLEFIYIQATNDREEEFEYCSAGRRGMWGVYSRLIQMAEKLGMLVVGLSLPTYYFFDRQKTRAAGHFRMMGGFDTVAAEIICGHTEGNNFVVFLGSGHWPHLSRRLTLQLTGERERSASCRTSQEERPWLRTPSPLSAFRPSWSERFESRAGKSRFEPSRVGSS